MNQIDLLISEYIDLRNTVRPQKENYVKERHRGSPYDL